MTSNITPNKERIREWVRALRSGEYQQARTVLRYDRPGQGSRYCCLGVATDLYRKAVGGTWEPMDVDTGVFVFTEEGREEYSILPPSVALWFGLPSSPTVDAGLDDGRPHSLVALNDYGVGFRGIANILERTYLPEDVNANEPEGLDRSGGTDSSG